MTKELEDIQAKIDAVQVRLGTAMAEMRRVAADRLNAFYAARAVTLSSKAPKTFWALVLRSHTQLVDELFGTYDDRILDHLEDMSVTYAGDSSRVTLKFRPNPFFGDAALWAEGDLSDTEKPLTFSGVHWKPKHGPYTEEEEEARDKAQNASPAKPGDKRARDAPASGSDATGDERDRGDSFFAFFEDNVGPRPEPNEDDLSDDDDANSSLAEAQDNYDEEMGNRRQVFEALINEVWTEPAAVVAGQLGEGSDEGDNEGDDEEDEDEEEEEQAPVSKGGKK